MDHAIEPNSEAPAVTARRLIRMATRAALGTILVDADGAPFVSMIVPASDIDGAPLLLLSQLAQHSRNLARDPRASLLIEGTVAPEQQQAVPRLTLTGQIVAAEAAISRARYAALYPNSALGVLADFHLWRFEIDRVFFIGGFAQARRLEGHALLLPAPSLEAAAPELLRWLNEEHLPRLRRSAAGPSSETAVSLDAEGVDLAGMGGRRRLNFPTAAFTPDAFRDSVLALSATV